MRAGFSMTELVIVISVIGVISGLAVSNYGNLLKSSKETLAVERVEMLNRALSSFAVENFEQRLNRIDSSTGDELAVLLNLQFENPNPAKKKLGQPYFDARYRPSGSSDSNEYRSRWNGRSYELLRPGTSGSGILMNFNGSDFTTPFVFDEDFKLSGR